MIADKAADVIAGDGKCDPHALLASSVHCTRCIAGVRSATGDLDACHRKLKPTEPLNRKMVHVPTSCGWLIRQICLPLQSLP
jgi:hypothetical protein